MEKRRIAWWLKLLLAGVGLLMVIPAVWVYMSLTSKPLHPDAGKVPATGRRVEGTGAAGAVERARQMVIAHMTKKSLPGVAVAVGLGGEVVWTEGFGYADLRTGEAVTPEHRFRIGTASMALTAAGAGLLVEQGRLKLDEPVQTYVAAFPKKEWPVTLRHLMGHTAGVINDGGDEGPLFTKHCEGPGEALPYFSEDALMFRPGTEYRRSSYGWIVVSAAMEAAAKRPFAEWMREQVFAPLGMRDTGPDGGPVEADDDFPIANLVRELIVDPRTKRDDKPAVVKAAGVKTVTPYFPRFAADPAYGLHQMRPLDYSCYAGASVFVSTAPDLARFGMAVNGGKLLRPETVEMLQRPGRLEAGLETGYGLGWYVKSVSLGGKQTRVTGHNGESLGGMVASLLTAPEHGLAVVVLTNISYAETDGLALALAEAFVEQGARLVP